VPLAEAVSRFVTPGAQLCFASTPSRSNAAIRELARQFRHKDPRFTFLATGYHSEAHLLGLLRLGRRYVGCFFGDNYPVPRANRLYAELEREGDEIEPWSLLSYCAALAAGALGQPYALDRSLRGTTLAHELERRGRLIEVSLPDADGVAKPTTLLRALRSDVTFLHAPLADEHGNVAFSAPFGEGFHSALGARSGCIVTVERVVPSEVLERLPQHRPLPAHRVLAVCVEPFGAHPQPLHVAPPELRQLEPGYGDDYAAYATWRAMTEEGASFRRFSELVLDASDAAAGYRAFCGPSLEALREPPPRSPPAAMTASELEPSDHLLLLAGRALARRIAERGYRSMLAGIGQAFAACRFAKLLLSERGSELELMVETGFTGIDAARAHPFLLSRENIASASRLTSIDSVLGALCCGASSECIGVLGAGEIDMDGNVNSTRSGGELLVGPGGAPDIAACAREVMVLTRAEPKRLVRKVEHITSIGLNVRTIVTEACVLERATPGEPWLVRDVVPARAGALKTLLHAGQFRFVMPGLPPSADDPSPRELEILAELRWQRAPARQVGAKSG
jgi:acyl CoA:acetate/3-ketoacid CoA transferase alpha subunit/acyl CoA:acetate/3-ketoacid CoA transferase beta subunit